MSKQKEDSGCIGCLEILDRYFLTNNKMFTFNGKNFMDPRAQIGATLLIYGSVKGMEIREDYSAYFETRYDISNIKTLHVWLLNNDYLREPTLKEALSVYKVTELKAILESLGLKKSGNKTDLVDRIAANISKNEKDYIMNRCNCYFVSDIGKQFLEDNYDLVLFHRTYGYGVSFDDFMANRIIQGRKRQFHDTIFQALTQQAFICQSNQQFSQLQFIYFNISRSCYDEGRYEISLQYALYELYFSTNLVTNNLDRECQFIDIDYLNFSAEHIYPESTFNKATVNRIFELKSYYRENMINIIYSNPILPYCIFNRELFTEAIECMLHENSFDPEYYNIIIQKNYIEYMKRFL